MPRRRRNSGARLDVLLSSGRGIRFNKRHYEFLAAVLREYRQSGGVQLNADYRALAVADIAEALATAFGRDNPFFGRERFLEAVAQEVEP